MSDLVAIGFTVATVAIVALAAPAGSAPVRWSDTLPRKANGAERAKPGKRRGPEPPRRSP